MVEIERIPNKIRKTIHDRHGSILIYLLDRINKESREEIRALMGQTEDDCCNLCDECERERWR